MAVASLKKAEGHQLRAEGHRVGAEGISLITAGLRVATPGEFFIFVIQILYSGAFLAQKMGNC